MKAAIVFDLDGTLVDSLGDIVAAANRMLIDVGHDPVSRDVIGRFVGNGLPKLVERLIRHCELPMGRHAELTQLTLTHYTAAACETTVPYPGIPEALAQLQQMGCVSGVCTNKPEVPARHVLDVLDLSLYFDAVLGGDTLETRKPDPAHLFCKLRCFVGQRSAPVCRRQRSRCGNRGTRADTISAVHQRVSKIARGRDPSYGQLWRRRGVAFVGEQDAAGTGTDHLKLGVFRVR